MEESVLSTERDQGMDRQLKEEQDFLPEAPVAWLSLLVPLLPAGQQPRASRSVLSVLRQEDAPSLLHARPETVRRVAVVLPGRGRRPPVLGQRWGRRACRAGAGPRRSSRRSFRFSERRRSSGRLGESTFSAVHPLSRGCGRT